MCIAILAFMKTLKSLNNHASNLMPYSIITTLFFVQSWLKLPNSPEPFTATYIMGFVIVIPLVITLVLWGLSGFRGIQNIYRSKTNLLWFLSLIGFMGWAILSQHWDFLPDDRAGVAENMGLQILLVFSFAIVVLCQPPMLRWILGLGLCLLMIQGVIGALQVANQSSIGLKIFGEFTLNPELSGVGVIQSGDIRWLRPYGLLAHPNIFAGLLIFGLFSCGGFFLLDNRRSHIRGGVCFLAGLWVFLLTFSRGAWGSFGLGLLISLFFILRFYRIQIRFLVLGTLAVVTGVIFLLMYRPLIASRVGISEESIEMRSVADRIVFTEIALDAINTSPYIGIGAGNFPWYASHYLHYKTDYDLRGDNVHQVVLGIWAEYGLVGLILLGTNILTAIVGTMRNVSRYHQQRPERIAILGTTVALLAVGLFDHYSWTLIHIQILWFTLMSAGLSIRFDSGD
jgi:O-antigen ligase